MAKKKKPENQHVHMTIHPEGLARPKEPEPLRENEFDGLTEKGRHDRATVLIRDAWEGATKSFRRIGDVVFLACYDGKADAALAKGADGNKRFEALARSLSTLEDGPSKKVLSVARRIAAASHVVEGPFWKVAGYSHKEKLILLDDPQKLEEGAKHAVEFSWTVPQTEKWVDRQRKKKKKSRGKSASGTRRSCEGLIEAGKPASVERILREYAEMTPDEQKKFRDVLDEAREVLVRVRKQVGDEES